jgi:hypothetical protein
VLGYGLDDQGSSPGWDWEFFSSLPRPDRFWWPTQPRIQWVPRGLSLGVKRPGHEYDHSPPSGAEVKNACSYTYTTPIRLHGVVISYFTFETYRYVIQLVGRGNGPALGMHRDKI